jgi:hypothetical protein
MGGAVTHYAAQTSVPVEKSLGEIKGTLARYGASEFGYMENATQAAIGFKVRGWTVRFVLPLPDRASDEFRYRIDGRSSRKFLREPAKQHEAWEQACRQRWRALALCIKAKLEAVECGITSFEEEFLAHIVLPTTGQTLGEWAIPQLAESYESGRSLPLLGMGGTANG